MSAPWRAGLVLIAIAVALTGPGGGHAWAQDTVAQASPEISPEDRDRMAALEAEAIQLAEAGDRAGADARIVELIEIERRVHGEASPLLANSYSYRAGLAEGAGDSAAAILFRQEELAIRERAGDPLALAVARAGLAVDLGQSGRYAEAEPLYRAALGVLPPGPERLRADLGLGDALLGLGRYDEAETVLTPAFEQAMREPPAEPGLARFIAYDLAITRYNAGRASTAETPARAACGETSSAETVDPIETAGCFLLVLILQGTERRAEAEPYLVRVVAAADGLSPDDRASAAQALAAIREAQGRAAEIEPLLRMALDARLEASDAPTREQGYAASSMGVWLDSQDRTVESEAFNRQAVDLYRRASASELDIAISVANLADTLIKLDRAAEAETLVRQAQADAPPGATAAYDARLLPALVQALEDRDPAEAIALRQRIIADAEAAGEPPAVLAAGYSALANAYSGVFDWAKAVEMREKAVGLFRQADSPLNAALELANYGRALEQVDDHTAAYAVLIEARSELQALSATEDDRIFVELDLASAAVELGRADEALALIAPVVAAGRQSGRTSDLVGALQVQADILGALGRTAEAEAILIEARGLVIPGDLTGDYTISVIDTALSLIWQDQGRFDEAERALRGAIDTANRLFGPESLEMRTPLNNLAVMLMRTGRSERALALLQQAAAIEARHLPADAPSRLDTDVKIARLLGELGRPDEAEALLAELVPRTVARLGDDAPVSREARRQYGFLLVQRQDYAGGVAELESVVAMEQAAGDTGKQAIGTLQLLSYALYSNGEYERTISLMREAVARLSAPGATRLSIDLRSNLGKVLIVDGRPDEALVPLRDATARSIRAAAATRAGAGAAGPEIARDPFRVLVEAAWDASR